MRMSSLVVRPSQELINSAFTILETSWSVRLLSRKKESISSMKMILGWSFRAKEKRAETSLLLSPYHCLIWAIESCSSYLTCFVLQYTSLNMAVSSFTVYRRTYLSIDESRSWFFGKSFRKQSLATARGTVQKNTFWRSVKSCCWLK